MRTILSLLSSIAFFNNNFKNKKPGLSMTARVLTRLKKIRMNTLKKPVRFLERPGTLGYNQNLPGNNIC